MNKFKREVAGKGKKIKFYSSFVYSIWAFSEINAQHGGNTYLYTLIMSGVMFFIFYEFCLSTTKKLS